MARERLRARDVLYGNKVVNRLDKIERNTFIILILSLVTCAMSIASLII